MALPQGMESKIKNEDTYISTVATMAATIWAVRGAQESEYKEHARCIEVAHDILKRVEEGGSMTGWLKAARKPK